MTASTDRSPSGKVRADYEQLAQIARTFDQQAEAAQKVLGALQKDMGALQGGRWVGQGAAKFYAEMNRAVLPSMRRLAAALNQAASTTTKVSRVMKQAEDDSAALFRLDGTGAGTPASTRSKGSTPEFIGQVPNPFYPNLEFLVTKDGQIMVRDITTGELVRHEAWLKQALEKAAKEDADDGILDRVGGFFKGVVKGVVRQAVDLTVGALSELRDMVHGFGYMLTHPWQTLKGIKYALTHLDETWDALKKPYVEAWEAGRPMEAIGRGLVFFGSLIFGGKLLKTAMDARKAAKLAKSAGGAGKAGELASGAGKINRMARTAAEIEQEFGQLRREIQGIKNTAVDVVEEGLEGGVNGGRPPLPNGQPPLPIPLEGLEGVGHIRTRLQEVVADGGPAAERARAILNELQQVEARAIQGVVNRGRELTLRELGELRALPAEGGAAIVVRELEEVVARGGPAAEQAQRLLNELREVQRQTRNLHREMGDLPGPPESAPPIAP